MILKKKKKKKAVSPKSSQKKERTPKSQAAAKKSKLIHVARRAPQPVVLSEKEKKSRASNQKQNELLAQGLLKKESQELLKEESVLESSEERRRRKRDQDEDDDKNPDSDYTLDRTPMKIYLKQIENIPLLKAEEEIELAETIRSKNRVSSAEARHKMIRSNLRLVIAMSKRYSNMGLAFSDLVEEGNLGLMRAVEKFNPDRGYRFSTYASWWIKQSIMRALSNQGKTIRIPVYMYDIIAKWRRVRDGLMQKINRMPTRKEIAKVMQIPVQKVKEIENITGRPSSLNAPLSLDGAAEMIDLIEDDSSHGPDAYIGELLQNERIQKLLNQLDEREKRILILRFGLGNHDTHTLEEAAQEFNITRERVRQIETVALRKIREQLVDEKDKLDNYVTP